MQRSKERYRCRTCGYLSTRWMGRCPECGNWDSLEAEAAPAGGRRAAASPTTPRAPAAGSVRLAEIDVAAASRVSTGLGELDRVLGGGLVPGSVVLVGGEPGVGKSTLLLRVADQLGQAGLGVVYVTGEESPRQIRLRADRLGIVDGQLSLLPETDLEGVLSAVEQGDTAAVIIDSIQTLRAPDIDSAPGSVTQVRECTARLAEAAKRTGTTLLLVGHVTKEGQLAGPRVIEHIVDVVLLFEGERIQSLRVLRGSKNRFGSTNEVGVFDMRDSGLVEVPNPSQLLLEERLAGVSGTVATCSLEGTRPLLLEIQALAAPTPFAAPRRIASGLDVARLNLILAVLEQRAGIRFGQQDVYVNVVGGVRITEPAADLAVAVAIVSSHSGEAVPADTLVFGELGLTGEVRAVNQTERRLEEAARLGFATCVLPRHGMRGVTPPGELTVHPVRTLREAVAVVLDGTGAR